MVNWNIFSSWADIFIACEVYIISVYSKSKIKFNDKFKSEFDLVEIPTGKFRFEIEKEVFPTHTFLLQSPQIRLQYSRTLPVPPSPLSLSLALALACWSHGFSRRAFSVIRSVAQLSSASELNFFWGKAPSFPIVWISLTALHLMLTPNFLVFFFVLSLRCSSSLLIWVNDSYNCCWFAVCEFPLFITRK